MSFDGPNSTLFMFLSTIAISFTSALIPVVNIEVYVVFLGIVAPRSLLPLLLVTATMSHMLGKSLMYLAGRSFDKLPYGKLKERVAAAKAKIGDRAALGAVVVFASALTGIPPFYLTTIAAGVWRFNFWYFFWVGFAGRLLRLGALIFIPQLAGVAK
ncbi:MAG: VTT domain-containing protein [Gemmatimonadaceae bacterium]